MPTNHRITLLTVSGEVEGLLLQNDVKWNEGRPNCRLELTAMGRTIAAEGIDWFEAIIGIRQQIEPEGLLLNVYGASRNVWPSGMCRNMGMGLKAYKMQIGKQAEKSDLVSVFASGPDVEPATIEEQRNFKDAWFASFQAPA